MMYVKLLGECLVPRLFSWKGCSFFGHAGESTASNETTWDVLKTIPGGWQVGYGIKNRKEEMLTKIISPLPGNVKCVSGRDHFSESLLWLPISIHSAVHWIFFKLSSGKLHVGKFSFKSSLWARLTSGSRTFPGYCFSKPTLSWWLLWCICFSFRVLYQSHKAWQWTWIAEANRMWLLFMSSSLILLIWPLAQTHFMSPSFFVPFKSITA